MATNDRPLPLKVKEAVDFIYEMLAGRTEPYHFSAEGLGRYVSLCNTCLIKRGIVKKEIYSSVGGVRYAYTWVATMAPTRTLYENITNDVRAAQKVSKRNSNAHAAKSLKPVVGLDLPDTPTQKGLDAYSTQQLWDELKRRGCVIDDNRLAIISKTYFD